MSKKGNAETELRELLLEKSGEIRQLKHEIDRLRKLAKDVEQSERAKRDELSTLKKECERKDKEIKHLTQHIAELKDVLQQSVKPKGRPEHRMGISAEPLGAAKGLERLQSHPKDTQTKAMIQQAIHSNDFLRNLDRTQVQEIIDCMFSQEFKNNQFVCREGAVGTELYVIASGEVEVTKNGHVMGPGRLFGELAILYNCTRTATVKALTNTKVWTLDRNSFQTIMRNTGMVRQTEYMNFLKSVPEFQHLT